MEEIDNLRKLNDIFFRHNTEREIKLRESKTRFVFYTTAENAYKIIKSKELWMRNILTMNDFSEFEHGRYCVTDALKSETGKELTSLLDGLFESMNVCTDAYNIFLNWSELIKSNTFITCFSEHDDTEDETGRLSMWRAYGGKNGIALVFDSEPFLDLYSTHRISTSSVAYLNSREIEQELSKVVTLIKANIPFLKTREPIEIYTYLYNLFKYAALCNKHPGFSEEREWRLLLSDTEQKENLEENLVTEIVRGLPQLLFKLPLSNIGLAKLAIEDVLDRVIIGPCEFPQITASAFSYLLKEIGIEDSLKKITISNIPLRHQT